MVSMLGTRSRRDAGPRSGRQILTSFTICIIYLLFTLFTMTDIVSSVVPPSELKLVKDGVANFVNKRAACKTRITKYRNKLLDLSLSGLTPKTFAIHKNCIEKVLTDVQSWDEQIINFFTGNSAVLTDPSIVDSEIDKQSEYYLDVQTFLVEYEPESVDLTTTRIDNSMQVMPKADAKAPSLQCGNFCGEDDRLDFRTFFVQFKNLIDSKRNLTNSAKLTYLRGYLRGYALKVISYLEVSDDNYDVALTLLKNEFLDVPHIKDQMFKKLLELSPKFDTTYQQTRIYINEVRSIVHEFSNYGLDFLTVDTAGFCFLSHIIFSKLPKPFQRELVHKVNNNYPTLDDIFSCYNDIIRGLTRSNSNKVFDKSNTKYNNDKTDKADKTPTLLNFKASHENSDKPCKFCNVVGHAMWRCAKYSSVEERISRCVDAGLCELCSSNRHSKQECPGMRNALNYKCFVCSTRKHISALCPERDARPSTSTVSNVCINYTRDDDSAQYLLPTLTVSIKRGNNVRQVRCLLDSGTQRSYFSPDVKKSLKIGACRRVRFCLRSYLSRATKIFDEAFLDINILGRKYALPMLFDADFSIDMNVPKLSLAVSNIRSENQILADSSFSPDSDNICLDGLIGIDILQFFPDMISRRFMNAKAWEVDGMVIPYGNVEGFLYPNQICPPPCKTANNDTIEHTQSDSRVNFVLSPRNSYFDPLAPCFPESNVERGLDNLFSLESIGINEDSDVSSVDEPIIQQFQDSIEFKDGKYHVSLPWYPDKLKSVPSNHNIALSILDKVLDSLHKRGKFDEYNKIFMQQLDDGIIEEISVDPSKYGEYIWIPHRAVEKSVDQCTTKTRAVYNCSLKRGKTPSLNEAAYKGPNLMTNLLNLILSFRTKSYSLISDIKQAFLMIMLKDLQDKNRFCFFMRDSNGNLKTYRFRTIVFGFTSSPFCLNYILKHHASMYHKDEISDILSNNLYVDNLLVTTNDPTFLKQVYYQSMKRMQEGGFQLRSWNTNEPSLRDTMKTEGTFVTHGKPFDTSFYLNVKATTFTIEKLFSFPTIMGWKKI